MGASESFGLFLSWICPFLIPAVHTNVLKTFVDLFLRKADNNIVHTHPPVH